MVTAVVEKTHWEGGGEVVEAGGACDSAETGKVT